jgi:hypothetical protein
LVGTQAAFFESSSMLSSMDPSISCDYNNNN